MELNKVHEVMLGGIQVIMRDENRSCGKWSEMNSLFSSIDRMEDIGENPTSPLRRDSLGREHH